MDALSYTIAVLVALGWLGLVALIWWLDRRVHRNHREVRGDLTEVKQAIATSSKEGSDQRADMHNEHKGYQSAIFTLVREAVDYIKSLRK